MAECLDEDVDPSVGFLYKTMLERDPRKRRVKPVQKHMLQVDFGGLDDSSDDSDFEVPLNKNDSGESSLGSEDDDGNSSGETGSDSGSDEDDEDEDEEEEKDEMGRLSIAQMIDRARAKLDIKSKLISEETTASNSSSCRNLKVVICAVCLGDISEEDNEIVECDGCGVSVHEGCYGISESQSIASTESSASTEPWFCDACKAGIKPHCELCPNTGGIYKETDAGRWVHLVCALYIPGVAFGDVDRLSPVTLFEMPYSKWGTRDCSLCEDERFSRTGVLVGCDAGMCRNYFHVTCAQREGLLSEASPDEDIADPFYAYCKQHADKASVRSRRQNWLAIQSNFRNHQETDHDVQEKLRVERKLNRHRQKYLAARELRPPHWVGSSDTVSQRAAPTGGTAAHRLGVPKEKLARMLTSSASAVRRLMQKAELLGINTQQHSHPNKGDIRKKWHVPPAFSAEFVGYFLDRNLRMKTMKGHLEELLIQRDSLQDQESVLRQKYDQLSNDVQTLRDSNNKLREEGEKTWKLLGDMTGKQLPLPEVIRPKKVVRSPRKDTPRSPTSTVIHQCGLCSGTNDQHLLAKCDKCKKHYHLGCLDPPLTRMPKKTKLQGWICSECTRSSDEEVNPNAPRRLRDKIKGPIKWSPLGALKEKSKDGRRKGIRKRGRRKKMGVTKAEPKLLNEATDIIEEKSSDKSCKLENIDNPSSTTISISTPPVKDALVKVSRTPVREVASKDKIPVKETPIKEQVKVSRTPVREVASKDKIPVKETPIKESPPKVTPPKENTPVELDEHAEKQDTIEPKEKGKKDKKELKSKKEEKIVKKEKSDIKEKELKQDIHVPEVETNALEKEPQEEMAPQEVEKSVEKASKKGGKGKMKKIAKEVKKEEPEVTEQEEEVHVLPPVNEEKEIEKEKEKMKKTTPKRSSAFDIDQIDIDQDIMPVLPPQRPQRTPRRKPETDMRTECCVCKEQGNNSSLVRCDECKLCYHFQCLDPPLKKTPKQRGYAWHCTACDPTEDEDEEEEEEEEEKEKDKKHDTREKPVKETVRDGTVKTTSPTRRKAAIQSEASTKTIAKMDRKTPREGLEEERKPKTRISQSELTPESSTVEEEKAKPLQRKVEKTKPTRGKVESMNEEKKQKIEVENEIVPDEEIKSKNQRKTPKVKAEKDLLKDVPKDAPISKRKSKITEEIISSIEEEILQGQNVPKRKRGGAATKACFSEEMPLNKEAPEEPKPILSQVPKEIFPPPHKHINTPQKSLDETTVHSVKGTTPPPRKRGSKTAKPVDEWLTAKEDESTPPPPKRSNVKQKSSEVDNVDESGPTNISSKRKATKKKAMEDPDTLSEKKELTPPPSKKTKGAKFKPEEHSVVAPKEKVQPSAVMKNYTEPQILPQKSKTPKGKPGLDSSSVLSEKAVMNSRDSVTKTKASTDSISEINFPSLPYKVMDNNVSDTKDKRQSDQTITSVDTKNVNKNKDSEARTLPTSNSDSSPLKIKSHEPKLPAKLAFKAEAKKVEKDFGLHKDWDSSTDEGESRSFGLESAKKDSSPQLVFWSDIIAATGPRGAAKMLNQAQRPKLNAIPEKVSADILQSTISREGIRKAQYTPVVASQSPVPKQKVPRGKGIEMVAARLMSAEPKHKNDKSGLGLQASASSSSEESNVSKSQIGPKSEGHMKSFDDVLKSLKSAPTAKGMESPVKHLDLSRSKDLPPTLKGSFDSVKEFSTKVSPPKVKDRDGQGERRDHPKELKSSPGKLSDEPVEMDLPMNLTVADPPKPTRRESPLESKSKSGILDLPKLTLIAEKKDAGIKPVELTKPGFDAKSGDSSDSDKSSKSEPHPLFGTKTEPRFPTVRSIFPPREPKSSGKSPGKSLESLLQRLTKKAEAQVTIVTTQKEEREMPVLVPEAPPTKKSSTESEQKTIPVDKPEDPAKVTTREESIDSPPTLEQEGGEKSSNKDIQHHSKSEDKE